jgi:PmbA protein
LIAEHNKEMQRDYYYTVARDYRDLENVETVAKLAAKRTADRLGAKNITTQHCPVIFAADVASSLIANFIKAISGANLYRKASFLLDHLGKQVFSKYVSIEENPFIPKALGSASFDTEGVKLTKTNIVHNGVLNRYVLGSYSARKLKMKTTGNAGGVHNIIIKTDSLAFDDLLKKAGTGLLVTELIGGNVNTITGDYSRGVFGYLIQNGKIVHPIAGATIAGNLKDIFLGIQDVSNDVDCRTNILTGSILIDKMTVAGS